MTIENRIKKQEGRAIYDQKGPDAPWIISYPRCGRHWYTLLLEKNLQIPITRYQTNDMPWGLPEKTAEDLRVWVRHELHLEFKPDNYIYLNREDPVDIVFSVIMMGRLDLDGLIESLLKERARRESEQLRDHRAFFLQDATLVVNYEDLKLNPAQVLIDSAEFLGETFDPENLQEVSREEVNTVFETEVSHTDRELYAKQKVEFTKKYGKMVRKIVCDTST